MKNTFPKHQFVYNDAGRYKGERLDCTVRALAVCLAPEMPYPAVHTMLKDFGRKSQHNIKTTLWYSLMDNVATRIVSSGHLTVQAFLMIYPKGRFVVSVRGHSFAVVNGVINDIPGGVAPRSIVKSAWMVAAQ